MSNSQSNPQNFVGGLIGGAIIKKGIDIALDKALDRVVKSPSFPVEKQDKEGIEAIVRNEVLKEVGPIVENMTNQEPLWRSKVVWTAVGTFFASIASVFDMYTNGTPDPAMQYYLAIAAAAGSIGTLYSRIFTTKAIGR